MLDELGLKYGTDKSSRKHNYLNIYEKHLNHLHHQKINLLEIGVKKGHSLKMWCDYFHNGMVYGIDITKAAFKYTNEKRIKVFLGDQSDAKFLTQLYNKIGKIDVIIDDGGHTMLQQQVSFQTLFPLLDSNGIYIIEDLHTSYHKEFRTNTKKTTIDFLKDIVDDVMLWGTNYRTKTRPTKPSYYEKHIASMTFVKSCVIIQKR